MNTKKSNNCCIKNILLSLTVGLQEWNWTKTAEAAGSEVILGTQLGL